MNIFDVLIIGGGPAGLSCALTLGSAGKKPFVADKKIGIFIHQSESGMHTALFNNALGINPGTKGGDILPPLCEVCNFAPFNQNYSFCEY